MKRRIPTQILPLKCNSNCVFYRRINTVEGGYVGGCTYFNILRKEDALCINSDKAKTAIKENWPYDRLHK